MPANGRVFGVQRKGEGKGDEYEKHAHLGVFLVLWKGKWANMKNTPIRAHFSCLKEGGCGEGRGMVMNTRNTPIWACFLCCGRESGRMFEGRGRWRGSEYNKRHVEHVYVSATIEIISKIKIKIKRRAYLRLDMSPGLPQVLMSILVGILMGSVICGSGSPADTDPSGSGCRFCGDRYPRHVKVALYRVRT